MILVRSFLIFQSINYLTWKKKASCENFTLLSKYLDYTDYFLNFELFYRNICDLGFLSNEDLDFAKTTSKETVLTSYRNYSN